MLRILHDQSNIIVSEQTPTKRTVNIDGYRHFLNFPYTIFVSFEYACRDCPPRAIPNKQHLFFTYAKQSPLRFTHEDVSIIPLPNTYPDGRICLGYSEQGHPSNHHKFHTWAINRYFSSQFAEGELQHGYWKTYSHSWKQGNTDFPLKCPLIERIQEYRKYGLFLDTSDLYHQRIEKKAYQMWEEAGRPNNQEQYFWNKAEMEIVEEMSKL